MTGNKTLERALLVLLSDLIKQLLIKKFEILIIRNCHCYIHKSFGGVD